MEKLYSVHVNLHADKTLFSLSTVRSRLQLSSSNDQVIYSSTQHLRNPTARHQHLVNMEFSTTAILAAAILALGFSGITSASSLYDNTCHNFDIHDLDGEAGRAVRLYAECKNFNGDYVQTNLDLNTCFGWADCEFAPYDKYGLIRFAFQERTIYLNPRKQQEHYVDMS